MLIRRTILLSLAFLALLCLQAQAFPLLESNFLRKEPLMNAIATSSGVIDLKKESNSSATFYVEADLSNLSSSSEKNSSDTVKMMISLVNHETMVAENCLGFSSYDCSKHNCRRQGSTKTISFPWFNATAEASQSELYLDYKYWSLSSAPLYIAKSCPTSDSLTRVGSGFSGVLGFGTGFGVVDSFTAGPIFSIFIEPDLSAGKLLFKKDTSRYAQPSSSPITMYSSSGWDFNAGRIIVDYKSIYVSSCIFDINSDAIGIPESDYKEFLNAFASPISGIWCKGDTYRPYCYTLKDPKDLPKILISPSYNQQVPIPPEIYMTMDKDTGVYKYFYLNFKATSPSLTGPSYVPPSLKYNVILDANFMSYYYTVFDSLGDRNMIYIYPSINAPASTTPRNPNSVSPNSAVWMCALLMLSVCVCCYCCSKRKSQGAEKKTLVNETTEDFYITPQNEGRVGSENNASPYKSGQSQQSRGIYPAY